MPGPKETTMWKVLTFLRRNPVMTPDEFVRYWHDVHAPLMQQQDDFWRHVEGLALETLTDEYDFAAELGCDSVEAMQTAFARPEYMEIIRPDELRFASADDTLRVVTREAVLYERVSNDNHTTV